MRSPLLIPESLLLTGTSLLLYRSLSNENNSDIQCSLTQQTNQFPISPQSLFLYVYIISISISILFPLLPRKFEKKSCRHYKTNCTIILGRLGVDRSVSHNVLHLSTSVWYPASDGSRYISAPNPLPTVLRLDSLSRV